MYTVLHTESSKGLGGQENRILRESVGLRKLGAGAMVVMLKDCERARNMGKKGRGIVMEHFAAERMCQKVHALYHALHRGKNP